MKQGEVAGLCGRIAAHIYYAGRRGFEYHLDYIFMHAGSRGVDYHHVGTAVTLYKLGREHIFHISGIKLGIIQTVDTGIDLGVLDSLGHILHTHHMAA